MKKYILKNGKTVNASEYQRGSITVPAFGSKMTNVYVKVEKDHIVDLFHGSDIEKEIEEKDEQVLSKEKSK